MEKKITRRLKNGKTVYLSQTNCRYTVPASWDEEEKKEVKPTSYIETALNGFITCVFGEFMPLYEKVYKSKNKAQVEITTMRKMTKSYMDVILEPVNIWHPDKTMEWTSTCLHWLLNTSRTFDYKQKLMDRGDERPLEKSDLKRILMSLDTKPFKSQNICRFEEIRNGYKRLHSRKYRDTAIRQLVDYILDEDFGVEQAVPFLDYLRKSMMPNAITAGFVHHANTDRRVTANVLIEVTTQFRNIINCMEDVYSKYKHAVNRTVYGNTSAQIALYIAAKSFKHNKTVSEMIDGYYYANKYGCYNGKPTVNTVNNAITAMKMRDNNYIDESDFPLIIENGN